MANAVRSCRYFNSTHHTDRVIMTIPSNLEGFLSHNEAYVREFEEANYSNLPAVPNKLCVICDMTCRHVPIG